MLWLKTRARGHDGLERLFLDVEEIGRQYFDRGIAATCA